MVEVAAVVLARAAAVAPAVAAVAVVAVAAAAEVAVAAAADRAFKTRTGITCAHTPVGSRTYSSNSFIQSFRYPDILIAPHWFKCWESE
jgi:hypothetical protein